MAAKVLKLTKLPVIEKLFYITYIILVSSYALFITIKESLGKITYFNREDILN